MAGLQSAEGRSLPLYSAQFHAQFPSNAQGEGTQNEVYELGNSMSKLNLSMNGAICGRGKLRGDTKVADKLWSNDDFRWQRGEGREEKEGSYRMDVNTRDQGRQSKANLTARRARIKLL